MGGASNGGVGVVEGEFYGGNAGGVVVIFQQIEEDGSAIGAAEGGSVGFEVEVPIEATGEPTEELECGDFASTGVTNGDVLQVGQTFAGGGAVENLSCGVEEVEEAGPGEVADGAAAAGQDFNLRKDVELWGGVFPSLAVHDEAIHPGPQLRIGLFVQRALPPETEWQIGIEVGENDAGQASGGAAIEAEGDLFRADFLGSARVQVAMGGDPGVDGGFGGVGVALDEKGAEGVFGGEGSEQGGVGGNGFGGFAVDGEVDQ